MLLAAGRGSRFGGPVPKAFLSLRGQPLLLHSAERLLQALPAGADCQLVLMVHPDDRSTHLAACHARLTTAAAAAGATLGIVDGGATRQQSMRNGLAACVSDVDLVLVHDAARALLPIEATRTCMMEATEHGAALLAIPAPDTMKRVHQQFVVTTVDRTNLWLAQTPQVIRRDLLIRAFDHASRTGFEGTDDVSLVEHLGERVVVVPGSVTNLKITRPEDLPLAEAILAAGMA